MHIKTVLAVALTSSLVAGNAVAHPGHNPIGSFHHEIGALLVAFVVGGVALWSVKKLRAKQKVNRNR